jgi:hypothetical protein
MFAPRSIISALRSAGAPEQVVDDDDSDVSDSERCQPEKTDEGEF